MNLGEYQELARSTAIYLKIQGAKMIYPALGLIGECGEVAEKIKKLIRDSSWEMTPDRKEGIKRELGDCCWYIASVCSDTNLEMDMIYTMRGGNVIQHTRSLTIPSLVIYMHHHATAVALDLDNWCSKFNCHPNAITNFVGMSQHLSCILASIEEIGRRCNLTLEEIYVANMEKLLSRKQRGVIKGKGDNR